MSDEILLSLSNVGHTFFPPSGKKLQVLADINFTIKSGELLALLGPSGCGKSTLVRIAAGLLHPTQGNVQYRSCPLEGPNPKAALVFQQFALYPWLTVAQNIEQALIPQGIDVAARRDHVAEVINLIGLDGFEEAYPRELSGGMKQRVGIARALAVNPELLCMDEPFSQVDALTAETLRSEVVNLWRDREKYPQSILMVSHDIHEVAFMASRILVMEANPGHVKTIIDNPLPYPRNSQLPAYQALVNKLHDIITGLYLPEEEAEKSLLAVALPQPYMGPQAIAPVPLVEVRDFIGLLEAVGSRGGSTEVFRLTDEMGRTFTRILLSSKAAELLGFLTTPHQDDLILTDLGKEFIAANRKARKQLLKIQLMNLPLIRRLCNMLQRGPGHRLPKETLLGELAIQCPRKTPRNFFAY